MREFPHSNVAAHGPAGREARPEEEFRNHLARPIRSFPGPHTHTPHADSRPTGVVSNPPLRLWLLPFRVRGVLVCPNCWSAFCVGIGLSLRWFRVSKLLVSVGVGIGPLALV